MCDFNFDIKKDRVKSILALYSVFLALATPIKFYFDAFFKLLPYMAFSFGCFLFFLRVFFAFLENLVNEGLDIYPIGVYNNDSERKRTNRNRRKRRWNNIP